VTTRRFTLGQFIGLCFAALAVLLIVILSVFYTGSRRTILLASEQLMRQASRRVTERLDEHLGEAERLVAALESQAALGLVTKDAVESVLLGALGGHPHVTDVTLTYGEAIGTYELDTPAHDAGDLRLAPDRSGQISASRTATDRDGAILVRRLHLISGGWETEATWVARDGVRSLAAAIPASGTAPPDPTTHPTFTVPSRPEYRGRALWSDLAFYEADVALSEIERRRVVSVQKALWSTAGAFVGVMRVALQSDRIDALVRVRVDDAAVDSDDHVVFLCDRHGRLISRLAPDDRFALLDPDGRADADGDVRVVPAVLPAPVAAALAAPALREAMSADPVVSRLDVDGVSYLVSVAALLGERTQGWLVGIVVPEAHYLGSLETSRQRLFALTALLMLAAVAGAALMLRVMRRDLGRLIDETTRLRSFDFTPSASATGTFRDVRVASRSLEQAKTALRALGKYVPLDLVRKLYDAHREPVLGAELQDVTLLFSDIAGFTTLAEALAPDDLAIALGAYLEVLTRAIHATGGIIDKYIGDGVMALWNTPHPLDRHATRACEAALACVAATDALFTSPVWAGRAPWRTRFGIHRAEVTVGHFGAPDRMSFTAMGDGVNLAARLESLGKQYGVHILVSAAVEHEARAVFWFRRLDRVAVKGKHMGVEIFELLDRRVAGTPPPPIVVPYEQALNAYLAGDFGGALTLLAELAHDPPSQVLAARCRAFLTDPPPADWNGIFVASAK
jgi:adenylate cyclase